MLNRIKQAVWVVFLACTTEVAIGETIEARDKPHVEALISNLLSKKVREFETPEKRNAKTVCDYMASIYEAPLIARQNSFCFTTGSASPRFPNIHDEEISELGRSGILPGSGIVSSSVKGTVAVVRVKAPIGKGWKSGRVVYFLRKTNDLWRISNFLAYREWPLELQREGGPCATPPEGGFDFALPPTGPDQLEDLPSPCREALVKAYNRDGWGK